VVSRQVAHTDQELDGGPPYAYPLDDRIESGALAHGPRGMVSENRISQPDGGRSYHVDRSVTRRPAREPRIRVQTRH